MLSLPFTKALSLVLGTALIGSAITFLIFNKTDTFSINQITQTVKPKKKQHKPKIIQISEEFIEPISPEMDYVVLFEGQNQTSGRVTSGKMSMSCQLTEETVKEACSFSKIKENTNKHWHSLEDVRKTSFDAHVLKNYFNETKTLYKVRISKSTIDKWHKRPNQNLLVYDASTSNKSSPTPLTTLKPTFSFKNMQMYWGKSQYYVGLLKTLKQKPSNSLNLALSQDAKTVDLTNRWFKCTLPGSNKTTEICFIYEFDSDESKKGNITNNILQLPLSESLKGDKDKYYLIKFVDTHTFPNSKYGKTTAINVDIYTDKERTERPLMGVNALEFTSLFNAVMHQEEWDIGTTILL